MKLQPGAFNKFLGSIGQNFLWRRASQCPCLNPMSGQPKVGCKQCWGKGVLWVAKAQAVPAVAGMTQQQNIKLWGQFGQYMMGDATLTIPENSPLYEAGRFDRIEMVNSSERFSKAMLRGEDRILQTVIKIDRVFWIDGDENIQDGTIPYVESDGSIIFPSDPAPPFGHFYTIEGEWRDEYFIWQQLVSDRGHHFGARLPKKVLARKLDLLGREG